MPTLLPESPRSDAAAELIRRLEASAPVKAGLLLYIDDIHGAHTISQELETELGSLWHGIVHRREGDFSNARYWFRRCQTLSATLGIDPVELTRLVELMHGDSPDEIVKLQRDEWVTVMKEALK